MSTLLRLNRPSAWLPIVMSLGALAVVLLHIVQYGVDREPDEGTAAHVWQLLMVAQLPLVAVFALTWMPRAPRKALRVLAIQLGAALAASAPVYLLGL